MKYLLLPAVLLSFSASADLYRWVDRESGSVKFSSTPPPWFGDPERARGAPPVEVIQYRGPAAPPKPVASEAGSKTALERRWRSALQQMAAIAERPERERNLAQLQEAIRMVGALGAELNKLDPDGTETRDRELQAAMERSRQALQAPK